MDTGKVEFAPDYKSSKRRHPDLPKDFGLIEVICAGSKHRFLPDAPKCGCGTRSNPEAERRILERGVIEAAKPWRMLLAEITTAMADRTGGPLSEDLIALNQRRVDAEVSLIAATDALIDFESQQAKP